MPVASPLEVYNGTRIYVGFNRDTIVTGQIDTLHVLTEFQDDTLNPALSTAARIFTNPDSAVYFIDTTAPGVNYARITWSHTSNGILDSGHQEVLLIPEAAKYVFISYR